MEEKITNKNSQKTASQLFRMACKRLLGNKKRELAKNCEYSKEITDYFLAG